MQFRDLSGGSFSRLAESEQLFFCTRREYDKKQALKSLAQVLKENHVDMDVRTLSTQGRELIGRDVNALENITGRDGAIVLETTLPSRVVHVEVWYKVENPENLVKGMRVVSNAFVGEATKEGIVFSFRDEPDALYMADAVSTAQITTGTLEGRFVIEFYCANPYKRYVQPCMLRLESGALNAYVSGKKLTEKDAGEKLTPRSFLFLGTKGTTGEIRIHNTTRGVSAFLQDLFKKNERIQGDGTEGELLKALDVSGQSLKNFPFYVGDHITVTGEGITRFEIDCERWTL